MTFNRTESRLAEAEAIAAALAIAKEASWKIDRHAPLLPKEFWNYLYIPAAELLLVPTTNRRNEDRFAVNRATREARSDALVVAVGGASTVVRQAFVSIALWGRDSTAWFGPHMPWRSVDGTLWLIPDADGGIDDEPSFILNAGRVREGVVPWKSIEDRTRGLHAATAIINAAIGGY